MTPTDGVCQNCKFWHQTTTRPASPSLNQGECRLNPPTATGGTSPRVWPVTHSGDWCGQFKQG